MSAIIQSPLPHCARVSKRGRNLKGDDIGHTLYTAPT